MWSNQPRSRSFFYPNGERYDLPRPLLRTWAFCEIAEGKNWNYTAISVEKNMLLPEQKKKGRQNMEQRPTQIYRSCAHAHLTRLVSPFDVNCARAEEAFEERRPALSPNLPPPARQGVYRQRGQGDEFPVEPIESSRHKIIAGCPPVYTNLYSSSTSEVFWARRVTCS